MNVVQDLQHVLRHVLESPHSHFYRTFYGASFDWHAITSLREWEMVPLLEKERLIATPFWERVFITQSEIDLIRPSSGTSGHNLLVAPKTHVLMLQEDMQPRAQTGLLSFLHPQHQFSKEFEVIGNPIPVIAGDASNAEQSVRIAAEVNVSALQVFPHVLEQILPLLIPYGLAEKCKLLILAGERVSYDDCVRYQSAFPNATIAIYYASTETQGLAGYAIFDAHTNMLLYRTCPDYYWELVDDNNHIITEEHTEGELVYTTLRTAGNPLPMVRYKTGDLASRHTTKNGEVRYQILGRKNIDRIKIPRGELRVEAVEHALKEVLGTSVSFELHYYAKHDAHSSPRIVLKIADPNSQISTTSLSDLLSKALRIAPQKTYDSLISAGIHAPLVCERVNTLSTGGNKRKKFHVHN